MNNTNQNHTDHFFRQALSSPPEFTPSDKNWQDMERLLKSEPRRRRMGWVYPVAGIAAALLIFLGLWLTPDSLVTDSPGGKVAREPVKNPAPSTGINSTSNGMQEPGTSGAAENRSSAEKTNQRYVDAGITGFPGNSRVSNQAEISSFPVTGRGQLTDARYLAVKSSSPERFTNLSTLESMKALDVVAPSLLTEENQAAVKAPSSSTLPGRWALSMAVSPDLNTVNGMGNSNFGLSMGMGVSYRLGKLLSVGTGVYYSQKLYSADKTSYKVSEKPFATWTSYSKQIDADCRVIDVPLNFSMQLANKKDNKLSVSAGLSSYFMLSEKYAFLYNPSPAYPTGRREYTIRNENQHYLSVVNLGIAVERPLTKQVSLVVQPYAKIPLTGIGKGETDLQSFGVGFKLNYSLKKKNAFHGERAAPSTIAKQE